MKTIKEILYSSAEELYGFSSWELPISNTPFTESYVLDVDANELTCESRYAPAVAYEGELYTVLTRVADCSGRRFMVCISVFRDCLFAQEYLKQLLIWSPIDVRFDKRYAMVGDRSFGLGPLAENSLLFIRSNVVVTVGYLNDGPDKNALLELAGKIDTQIRTQPHT